MQKKIYDLNKISEENFGLLMKAIEKVFPKFDYYAYNELFTEDHRFEGINIAAIQ
ncbi:hypothetical protein J5Y03_03875 [Bacillus sp. RG28]|uniref:Uncharacterized protein n=1 Tax=Gottfriedia endophytica TaxID=2820819 RepID=A0A940SFT0_9BACI|nr:hypothetical protein [Gottfriedia endophytica]MBP0724322.1 hypothetical protein [Gottfriedia endophytica]